MDNEYSNKLKIYEDLIKERNRAIASIGFLRLLTFIIGFAVTTYTFIIKSFFVSAAVLAISLAIFISLVVEHDKETNKRKYLIALKEINQRGLKRLNGQWKDFEDDGKEFKDKEHDYSEDLDIFGRGSLFQWINSSKTFTGREILKNRLIHPLRTPTDIKMTQQAVQELAEDLDWRQQFEAEGMVMENQCVNPKELYAWTENRNELYIKQWLILSVRIMPCITLILLTLPFMTSFIDYKLPSFMIFIQLIILFVGAKRRSETFNSLFKYKSSIYVYLKSLSLIIEKNFKSDYLRKLKTDLVINKNEDAVKAIKRLSSIYNRISDRQNVFYIIVDILLLWDYQCMIQFEKWRLNSGKNLKRWLEIVGEFEALSSISNIAYENQQWAMPLISDENFIIKAKGLGHPLLGDARVSNDITISKERDILLITGSNMSGKSTFQRTVGINLVLSYIGAPVCAKEFEASLLEVVTCMRTSDNMENNISSFYAEILRVKMIVEKARLNRKVFFLLDELFKGTNSIDRHDGAKALIKQLGKKGASGLVSTHDLELCHLQKEYPKIKNYHFEEYYVNNDLKFDYKIREGVSTTKNALYLIKLAGIEIKR